MRSDSAFAESRTVPSSQVRGCSPSSLYAFLVLPRLGAVLPYPHSGLRFHRLWRVIFPHIAVRTPILPKRDLNQRSRSAGYELDDQTLSPIDSVALIAMRHPKSSQKGQVLDPCWTLETRRNWMSRTQLAFNSGDLAFQEIITSRLYRDPIN